jgi:transposase
MRARFLKGHWRAIKRLLSFKKEAEKDGEYRVAKRIHAVVLNMEGRTSTQIAGLLKSPRSAVSLWLSNYEDHGIAGILEGQRSGRPCELSPQQLITLADIVESGPIAYGFLSGVWTSPMIARVIREDFGVEYHPGHVRKVLHQLGFSVQRPRRTLAHADETQRSRWKRYTYPNIKKKPKGSRQP